MSSTRIAERLFAVFGLSVFAILLVGVLFPVPASAWDCGKYNFQVTDSGAVQVENRSSSNENAQRADVFVNGSKVINDAAVPAMPKSTAWTTFATISPPSGSWMWQVKGESDCEDSGEHPGPTATATNPPTGTPVHPTERPTETGVPVTDTPVPTATASPTETAVPPSATAPPTDEPPPTDTARPDPSNTPAPTQKPLQPTATATTRILTLATVQATATPTATAIIGGCVSCCCACACGYAATPMAINVNVAAPAQDFSMLNVVLWISGANFVLLVYLILSRKSIPN